MCLRQSQNKNINNICIVGNPADMNSEQGGVKYQPKPFTCRIDCLFPYHVTGACVRTNPPSVFFLAGCLFNRNSKHCLISTQNRCHMDLRSI
jgi:hypothetical protein